MKPSLLSIGALLFAGLACGAEPTLKLDLGSGAAMDLVLVPAGQFTQGSPASEAGRAADESQRNVRISRDYYISRTAVTRGQWEQFIAETHFRTEAETGNSGGYGWDGNALTQRKEFTWKSPGFPQTAEHPVCLVTFPDAQAFCAWLEIKSGRKVTLPTEAQWEYACRAGSTTAWRGADAAWHKDNAGNGTHAVTVKPANPWGLFIGGNVAEWCLDWYAAYPAGDAVDPRQDNPNLSDKPRRVLRGGSWIRGASNTRNAARYRADPRSRNADIGFRVTCSVESATPSPAVTQPAAPHPATPPPHTELAPAKANAIAPLDTELPIMPLPSQDAPSSETTEAPQSTVPEAFKGLLCLLIPTILIVILIRRILGKRNSDPQVSNPYFKAAPRPTYVPPAHDSSIRKTDDGFWIQGDWPEGTPLTVRHVIAGAAMAQEILYRPGANGQFVFTGGKPDSISVVEGSHSPQTATPPPMLPQRQYSSSFPQHHSTPPQTSQHYYDHDNDRRPPISPSAY